MGGSRKGFLVDKELNDSFGKGIDDDFFATFKPYIIRLDLRSNREKKYPPLAMGFTPDPGPDRDRDRDRDSSEGQTWTLQPGGKAELRTVERKITARPIGERVEILAYIRGGASLTPDKMVDIIWTTILRQSDLPERNRKWLQDNKTAVLAQIRGAVVAEEKTEVKPIVSRSLLHIMAPSFLRSVAKIACNYFALYNRAAFLSNGCNRIREYVLHGRGEGEGQILLCSTPPPELSGMRHGVVFHAHDDGEAVAAVTLFGSLHFFVKVGDVSMTETSCRKSLYTVDQPGQKTHEMIPDWDLPRFDVESTLAGTAHALGLSSIKTFLQTVEVASMVYHLAKEPNLDKTAISLLVENLVENLVLNGILVPPRRSDR